MYQENADTLSINIITTFSTSFKFILRTKISISYKGVTRDAVTSDVFEYSTCYLLFLEDCAVKYNTNFELLRLCKIYFRPVSKLSDLLAQHLKYFYTYLVYCACLVMIRLLNCKKFNALLFKMYDLTDDCKLTII